MVAEQIIRFVGFFSSVLEEATRPRFFYVTARV